MMNNEKERKYIVYTTLGTPNKSWRENVVSLAGYSS